MIRESHDSFNAGILDLGAIENAVWLLSNAGEEIRAINIFGSLHSIMTSILIHVGGRLS